MDRSVRLTRLDSHEHSTPQQPDVARESDRFKKAPRLDLPPIRTRHHPIANAIAQLDRLQPYRQQTNRL
ncbi:MAG: hypothetical protein ACF8CQ_12070, partial [Rhodopirellula sp. JB044]|uniref:hypothetical protein n=1 Tax=Rhodopirellula sp. JB044 TaxID=3342844 RepID=UPI00370CC449